MGEDRALAWVPESDLNGRALSEDQQGEILRVLFQHQPLDTAAAKRITDEWLIANVHGGHVPRLAVA